VVVGLAWAGGAHRWIQAGLALALAQPVQQPGALQEFVVTLAEVLSGMLGFTLSVVAIVVQLSADRFTPKVTELFLREKTNFYLFSFLILANVVSLWSSVALGFYEDPQLLIGLNLLLGTASFLVLIPYFSFVFHFLQPTSIIRRIEQQVQQAILGASRWEQRQPSALQPCAAAHQRCLSALDEIKSIAISALRQREEVILLEALDSLKALWMFYAQHKAHLPRSWFLWTPALC